MSQPGCTRHSGGAELARSGNSPPSPRTTPSPFTICYLGKPENPRNRLRREAEYMRHGGQEDPEMSQKQA